MNENNNGSGGSDYREFHTKGLPGGNHMMANELDCYLTAEEYLLFTKFCKYVNKNGNADIKMSAKDVGMSDRTYRRTLGRLKSIGIIDTKRHGSNFVKQINYEAILTICEIFQTFEELRNNIREFVGEKNVMHITDKELNRYADIISKRKKNQ